jgi:hypothetical protein
LLQAQYKRDLRQLVFSPVSNKNLINDYLTAIEPAKCRIAMEIGYMAKDDLIAFDRFGHVIKDTKIAIFKVLYTLALDVADILRLGDINMKFLFLSQDKFCKEGLTGIKFLQRVQLYQEYSIRGDAMDPAVIRNFAYLCHKGWSQLSQAIIQECPAPEDLNDVREEQQPGLPNSVDALRGYIAYFAATAMLERNERLLREQERTFVYVKEASKKYKQQDHNLEVMKHEKGVHLYRSCRSCAEPQAGVSSSDS